MKIGVAVILYHPTAEDLQQVERLREHYAVAAVDNTTNNRGIAAAQNEGIRMLRDMGAEYVVLLDQDSRIGMDFPQQMVDEYLEIEREHPNLATLGPTLYYHPQGESRFVAEREIIASGSCMRIATWEKVGGLDEDLFIDYVDFEWCWRAAAKGYLCGRTTRIRMDHHVGQHVVHFGRYYIFVSSPIRYYYQYRNHKQLCRRDYVPTQWKIATGIKHIARFIYLPWIYGGKELWAYMWRGWTEKKTAQ